jgi:hypothetical protein
VAFNNYLSKLVLIIISITACSSQTRPPNIADALSKQVTAEGIAVIGTDREQSRRAAIDQAIASAASQMGAKRGNENLISDIKVVDEWIDNNNYHVQILAIINDKPNCAAMYRKKIVATAFPIMNADQISISESQDLFGGIPREINNQLMQSGEFIGRNYTNVVLYARPDIAPDILPTSNYNGSSIINISRQQDAQFVLSGVIRDFKIESAEYVRGSGILAEIKSLTRDMVARRSIGIDVYVHDGFTGALLFQQRYLESVVGDVSLPAGYTVASERFNDTPVGHKIQQIINQASEDIRRLLSCYPFASRVLQVSNTEVVISAGAQDKIKPGDRFLIYPFAMNSNGKTAAITNSSAILTINNVNATTAVGQLDKDNLTFSTHPGDWVKSLLSQ